MRSSSVVYVLFFIFFLSLFSSTTSRSISIASEEVSHHEKAEWFMKSSHFAKFLPQKAGLSLEELPKVSSPPSNPLVPVVIVPSFFGNAIYASLSHADPGHFYCRDNSKDYVLFFDELRFIPPLINCWMADMLIEYSNHTYSYPEGVEINAEMDYGNTTVLEWINSGHTIGIWNSTVAALVAAGYERGVSVRGAPADWRLGANGWTPYWSRLKGLIEETYTLNGNQKVAVAALSMGSPYFLGFLNTMVNQTWKDTYIHSFTSMSGVFGGSSAAIAALLGKFLFLLSSSSHLRRSCSPSPSTCFNNSLYTRW
jgi:hypothetical protein